MWSAGWGPTPTHETESPWPVHFKHSRWWKWRSRSTFASHSAWGTNRVCECTVGVKPTRVPYMASYGACSMVTWTIFRNHLLKVGLTQNQETMTLCTLATIGLFYFIMCEGPTWIEHHSNSIRLRARSHVTSHYTWGSVTTLHDVGGVLGTAFGHFLLASHNVMVTALWLVCESGPEGGGCLLGWIPWQV